MSDFRDMAATNSEAERSRDTLVQKISQFYKDLNLHLNLESDSEPSVVFGKVCHEGTLEHLHEYCNNA